MKESIIKALVKVQEEIQNPANTATNPFFKSSYAPLPDILNLVRPLLAKNGLVLIQNTGTWPDGTPYIQTSVHHESGDSFDSDKLSLKPDKSSPQGIGSALSYGRRYQLTALLGIAGEEDDDGNAAEPKKQKESKGKGTRSRGERPKSETTHPAEAEVPKGVDPENVQDAEPTTKTPQRPKRTRPARELIPDEVVLLKKKNSNLKKAIEVLDEDGCEISRVGILKILENMLGDKAIPDFDLESFKQCKKDLKIN